MTEVLRLYYYNNIVLYLHYCFPLVVPCIIIYFVTKGNNIINNKTND